MNFNDIPSGTDRDGLWTWSRPLWYFVDLPSLAWWFCSMCLSTLTSPGTLVENGGQNWRPPQIPTPIFVNHPIPYAPCMEYLPTFTPKINPMLVNMPYVPKFDTGCDPTNPHLAEVVLSAKRRWQSKKNWTRIWWNQAFFPGKDTNQRRQLWVCEKQESSIEYMIGYSWETRGYQYVIDPNKGIEVIPNGWKLGFSLCRRRRSMTPCHKRRENQKS